MLLPSVFIALMLTEIWSSEDCAEFLPPRVPDCRAWCGLQPCGDARFRLVNSGGSLHVLRAQGSELLRAFADMRRDGDHLRTQIGDGVAHTRAVFEPGSIWTGVMMEPEGADAIAP